jgi:GT2 family glycosyltransferase
MSADGENKSWICAVICTYNRYDVLEGAIASLREQSLPKSRYRILIVDNSPVNNLADDFQSRYHGTENIHYCRETTPGLSNARNRAMEMSPCEIITFMDDDAEADNGWLEAMLEAFDRFGEEVAVAGGPVAPIWPGRQPTWLAPSMLPLLSVLDWGGELRYAGDREWFAGTNIAFRRSALIKVGGFSTHLGRKGSLTLESGEEGDLVNRLLEHDARAVWVPGAQVRHRVHENRVSQIWLRKRKAWQAVSDLRTNPDGILARDDLDRCVMGYMDRIPLEHQTHDALFRPVEDPDLFALQLEAVYASTAMLLLGNKSVEGASIKKGFKGRGLLAAMRLIWRRGRRSMRAN